MDYINQFIASGSWKSWIGALAVLIIGVIVAYILRAIVSGAINRTGLGKRARTTGGNIGKAMGKAVFWLAILYTLFLTASRVGMGSYFAPVENLFNDISGVVPNLIGAGFIGFIGFIIAKVAGTAVMSVAEAAQVDSLAARSGLTSATGSSGSISKLLGTVVFVLIIVPVAIAVLEKLNMQSVSLPLSGMLNGFISFLPALVAAAILLAATIFIGKFVSTFIRNLLAGLGFDRSVNAVMSLDDGEGLKTAPSKAAGYVAFLIILVIGVSAAVDILGNDSLTSAFGTVQTFGGSLLRAAILIGIGVFLANFMGRFLSTIMNAKLASFVKYFAMVLFVFLGLSSLDPEGQIVPRAFTAFVFAASVAAALAFGLGGRDWAKAVLNKMAPPANMSSATKKVAPKRPIVKK